MLLVLLFFLILVINSVHFFQSLVSLIIFDVIRSTISILKFNQNIAAKITYFTSNNLDTY